MYLGPSDGIKWPYYFITGSAGTGKSYMINLIKDMLDRRQSNYLLLAPTGVAAQNINGRTIHSELQILSNNGNFYTRAYSNRELTEQLKNIDTLIIDEGSMVSDQLFDFISNIFASLHSNAIAFGGINTIVVGDLAQLPPVRGQPIFKASSWKLFYPLFLKTSQRQNNDPEFYNMLEEIRFNNISTETWNLLEQRASEYLTHPTVDTLLSTTHIVGFRESAQQINRMICNLLPVPNNKFLISRASDLYGSEVWDISESKQIFKSKTNLPSSIRLQPGARVMYLNNSLIEHGICNGTMGIITDIDLTDQSVRVAFSVKGSIIDIQIFKHTHYFEINGYNCQRTQFPIQNCFASTVHKTQGLTLSKVCLALDGGIFSSGQAYVALSRCPNWNNIEISHLDRSAFITDPDVVLEYQRLENISRSHPNVFH